MERMQIEVRRFMKGTGLASPPELRIVDLASEVGELSKEILISTSYGKKPCVRTKGIEDEVGDSLFSLLALADSLGIDAQAALSAAIQKYRSRLDETGTAGSGGQDGQEPGAGIREDN